MKTDLILISGKQGSGKTTLVNAYKEAYETHDEKVIEVRFAGPIYAIHDRARAYVRNLGVEVPEKNGELLQYLGTEWGRKKLGEDVWVKCARGAVNNIKADLKNRGFERLTIIISDCRFPNEFAEFEDALRVRLEANGTERRLRADGWRDTQEHISETALDRHVIESQFDWTYYTDRGGLKPPEIAHHIREVLDAGTYRVDRERR